MIIMSNYFVVFSRQQEQTQQVETCHLLFLQLKNLNIFKTNQLKNDSQFQQTINVMNNILQVGLYDKINIQMCQAYCACFRNAGKYVNLKVINEHFVSNLQIIKTQLCVDLQGGVLERSFRNIDIYILPLAVIVRGNKRKKACYYHPQGLCSKIISIYFGVYSSIAYVREG